MAEKFVDKNKRKNKCIAIFKLGSATTGNCLADLHPGAHKNIELAYLEAVNLRRHDNMRTRAALRPSLLEAVATVRNLTPGLQSFNLLDVVEVLGDRLAVLRIGNEVNKRIVIFTHKGIAPDQLGEEECKQLVEVCGFYRDYKIRLDVVCEGWTEADGDKDDHHMADEILVRKMARSVAELFEYAAGKGIHPLWAMAHSTSGSIRGAEGALDAFGNLV